MADDSTALTGFFSYAHSDNIFNCLQNLRDDVCREYQILTGQKLELFIDVRDLAWGSHWHEAIKSGIATSSFFLPVLSPSYFMSEACVQELQQYMEKVERTNTPELILPLLFSSFKDIKSSQDDSLVEKMRNVQWIDISHVQEYKRQIGPYGALVLQIAQKLKRNNAIVFSKTVHAAARAKDCANTTPSQSIVDTANQPSAQGESGSYCEDTHDDAESPMESFTVQNHKGNQDELDVSCNKPEGDTKAGLPKSITILGVSRLRRIRIKASDVTNAVNDIYACIRSGLNDLGRLKLASQTSDHVNQAIDFTGYEIKELLEPMVQRYETVANELSRLVNDYGGEPEGSLTYGIAKVIFFCPDGDLAEDFHSSLSEARTAINKLSFLMHNKRMRYFSRILQGEIAEIKYCNATALGAIEFALTWEIRLPGGDKGDCADAGEGNNARSDSSNGESSNE